MLSVCIPIYDFDVRELVGELDRQVLGQDKNIEIVCIDDASDPKFRASNNSIIHKTNFVQLDENVGRARIRNLFVGLVKYDHLLFLDCDSLIIRSDFLSLYLREIQHYPEAVICGGREYPRELPSKQQSLRWKYGHLRESKSVQERSSHPYRSFLSNNFVTPKSVLECIPFHEELRDYGHEDTLFGYELKKHQIPIDHIDNPVLNGDIEDNVLFLKKTDQAIGNLAHIVDAFPEERELQEDLHLWKIMKRIQPLLPIISRIYPLFEPRLIKNLLGPDPKLKYFDVYRLMRLYRSLR